MLHSVYVSYNLAKIFAVFKLLHTLKIELVGIKCNNSAAYRGNKARVIKSSFSVAHLNDSAFTKLSEIQIDL